MHPALAISPCPPWSPPQNQHVQIRARHHLDPRGAAGHGGEWPIISGGLRPGLSGGGEWLAALAGEPLQQQGVVEGGGG